MAAIITSNNKNIKVTDLETNEITEYDSIIHVSKVLDIQISNIITCCNANLKSKHKKYHRKNYILEYIL